LVTLVDTSAVYAFLDVRDANHAAARETFTRLLREADELTTHAYAVLESASLVQRRLGAAGVRSLFADVLPVIRMRWVDEATHRRAVASLLGSSSRAISLVDWASFVIIRDEGIDRAFAFDRDFAAQGIPTIPGTGEWTPG
jgi:predicted nucleic acid-binding protein